LKFSHAKGKAEVATRGVNPPLLSKKTSTTSVQIHVQSNLVEKKHTDVDFDQGDFGYGP
jgi:hypothetical protein